MFGFSKRDSAVTVDDGGVPDDEGDECFSYAPTGSFGTSSAVSAQDEVGSEYASHDDENTATEEHDQEELLALRDLGVPEHL